MPERMKKSYTPARKTGRSKTQGTQTKDYSKYRKPKVAKTQAQIRATVRAEILKAAEKKRFIFYGANQSLINAGGLTPSGQYLVPQIAQGTTDAQRIANKIKIVSGTLTGNVNLLPYNAVTNAGPAPVWVKIWLCRYKNIAAANAISVTNASTDFFAANGTNLPFQGTMLDMHLPTNDDSWTVFETRMFKLGATGTSATTPVSSGSYFDNSDMSKMFEFDVGKYLNEITYNDNSSVVPTNVNLFMVMQCVLADGSSSTVTPAEYHFCLDLKFIDL